MKRSWLVIVLIVFLGLITACNGQPRSDYRLSWNSEINSTNYMVFVEYGTSANPADYVLQDGMDYKTNGAETLVYISTADTTLILSDIDNTGDYIVYGVVGINTNNIYGAMGVIQPYLLPAVPDKILVLPPVRLGN